MENLKVVKWVLRFTNENKIGGDLIGVLSNGQEINAGHGFHMPYSINLDVNKKIMTADVRVELEGQINFANVKEKQ